MIEVGVRELKNSLSRYLRRVKEGETLVITERGEPVARIIPNGIPSRIAELISTGQASWSGRRFVPPDEPLDSGSGVNLSDYITEDRGD